MMHSDSVIVVASETYIKANNSSNELKVITEKCWGNNKKPFVVIALDSGTAQTLRRTTSVKSSSILVWGSPNFWQNISRNLMTKYQTFNSNKGKSIVSSPNKTKALNSDDDEIWTYLKTSSGNANARAGTLITDNSNRLSVGTLRENLTHMELTKEFQNQEVKNYSFNLPSSTLQFGKRRQYLKGNPMPSSTPTSRRTSQPQSSESVIISSKSRSPPFSKTENNSTPISKRNLHENPFESYRFEQFSHRKPPPYPNNPLATLNSNSDSDYMAVNDSLAPRNEPIYHTLDDDQQPSLNTKPGKTKGVGDQTVYINSALEVVYPTASVLKKQRQKLMELQRQNQYLKQRQIDLEDSVLTNPDDDDDDDLDEEFNELLGGIPDDGMSDQEDVYENGDENESNYYRGINDHFTDERKTSCTSNNYVPSPAPGSYPRNRGASINNHSPVVNGGQYNSSCLGENNMKPRRAIYCSNGPKQSNGTGSYYV